MHPFKKVIGRRVMCVFPKADEITAGGIIIPESQQDVKGKQRMEVALSGIEDIQSGDVVCFNKYHGSTIEIDGQEYLFLKEEEILGVM